MKNIDSQITVWISKIGDELPINLIDEVYVSYTDPENTNCYFTTYMKLEDYFK